MENKRNWLTDLLDDAGMTPADLERASGVDSSVISNVANGKKGIGTSLAQKFGRALDMDPGDILRAAGVWEAKSNEDSIDEQIKNIAKKFPVEEKKKIVKRLRLEASLHEQQRPSRP